MCQQKRLALPCHTTPALQQAASPLWRHVTPQQPAGQCHSHPHHTCLMPASASTSAVGPGSLAGTGSCHTASWPAGSVHVEQKGIWVKRGIGACSNERIGQDRKFAGTALCQACCSAGLANAYNPTQCPPNTKRSQPNALAMQCPCNAMQNALPSTLTVLSDDRQLVLVRVPGQPCGAAGQQPLLQACALVHVPQAQSLVHASGCQVQACGGGKLRVGWAGLGTSAIRSEPGPPATGCSSVRSCMKWQLQHRL